MNLIQNWAQKVCFLPNRIKKYYIFNCERWSRMFYSARTSNACAPYILHGSVILLNNKFTFFHWIIEVSSSRCDFLHVVCMTYVIYSNSLTALKCVTITYIWVNLKKSSTYLHHKMLKIFFAGTPSRQGFSHLIVHNIYENASVQSKTTWRYLFRITKNDQKWAIFPEST